MNIKNIIKIYFLFTIFVSQTLHAGVIIGGTRLIYNEENKESSLSVNNSDDVPYLIQSWLDAEDQKTSSKQFILTPPLFRLNGGERNDIRIIKSTGNMPQDRESLFWMNIKSIPQVSKNENVIQFAVNTRIKLINRPKTLANDTPRDLYDKLKWKVTDGKLHVDNPTPYYMNFQTVQFNGKEFKYVGYVAPLASTEFTLPQNVSSGKVTWTVIDDYGAVTKPITIDL